MIKVSIIVPVYNTEAYIEKCLESLCNLDFKKNEYEIIVVNDGSPDNSEKIINKYVKKYPKLIKYVKKENGGLSSARNAGIKVAKGEYILFVDSDDYVEKGYISLVDKFNEETDLIVFGYNEVYEDKTFVRVLAEDFKKDALESIPMFLENAAVRGYAWNKIYKRSIIIDNNLYYDESIKYIEDLPYTIKYVLKCNKIYFSKKSLYNYIQRSGSLVNSNFNVGKLTVLNGYKDIKDGLSSKCPEHLPLLAYMEFEINYELRMKMKVSKMNKQLKEEYKTLKKNMNKNLRYIFFENVKLKYKMKVIVKNYLFGLIYFLKYGGANAKN